MRRDKPEGGNKVLSFKLCTVPGETFRQQCSNNGKLKMQSAIASETEQEYTDVIVCRGEKPVEMRLVHIRHHRLRLHGYLDG